MPKVPILMPQLGESIAEATIIKIMIKPGASVSADEEIMEVETNKATMSVTTPCRGTVLEVTATPEESYAVGATLGVLEVEQEVMERLHLEPIDDAPREAPPAEDSDASGEANSHFRTNESAVIRQDEPVVEPTLRGGLPVPANATGATYLSPRMKARMHELGLNAADLAGVAGSGRGGRVTIEDFEKFVSSLEENKMTNASPMRIAVADSMRRSWSRPLATVGSPVVLDPMLVHRKQANPKPGPALYAMRALAIAISENTAVGGRLVGTKIVHPNAIDIGFAVEVADGVLVPVIRNVAEKPLSTLVDDYNHLVELARERKLPNDTKPGIATVTNFGTFGIVWATPIPLPEQNLVLGLGYGRKKPVWSNQVEQFVPVTEAEITLSFDHRVLDGGAAGRLLWRIGELLQKPEDL